jgi:hypothetical protein
METQNGSMQCNYVAVFAVHAVAVPQEAGTLQVYEDDGVLAVLTNDPTELLRDASRGAVLGTLLLKGVFGSPDPRDFHEKLQQEMAAAAEARQRAAGSAPYLVVRVTLEAEVSLRDPHKDLPDFSLYFDAIDKDAIRAQARPEADRVLAAVIVASDSDPRFDRLLESIYLIAPNGHVVYSLTASFGAAALLVRAFPKDLADLVKRYLSVSRRAGGVDLTSVYGLLRAAVDGRTEPLRAFVAAWSALEIFVNKVFGLYDRIWFDRLTAGHTAVETAPFSGLRDVMKGKHRLTDKFTVIAIVLDSAAAITDIAAFDELKRARDKLFHGGVPEDTHLPADRVLSLTRKYLRLHVERLASNIRLERTG